MIAKLSPLTLSLPSTGQLANGTWVSNYHLLPPDILASEGWLPCDKIEPPCTDTQTLELDSAVEVDGRIVLTYRAVDLPPDDIDMMLGELEAMV